MAAIKTRLIRIGNSQGIRIPKLLVDRAGLQGDLEIEAEEGQLIIRPARHSRDGWDISFEAMAGDGEDRLLDTEPLTPTTWEDSEWQW
ncbi:MAG TPA: AbrB/MazE/SpoVT family DNA-binding domain-containing protein [Armatimonadota bacterium]|nr:AbrB/MazE/SpoVT family DNA-binding domain-containing protein [Armatimonadota bacterium]